MNGKFSYCCWWTHRKWCVRDTLPWSQGLAPLFFPSAQLSNEIFQYPYLTCCHDAVKMLEIHLFVSLTRFIKRNNPFFFWQKRHTKKKLKNSAAIHIYSQGTSEEPDPSTSMWSGHHFLICATVIRNRWWEMLPAQHHSTLEVDSKGWLPPQSQAALTSVYLAPLFTECDIAQQAAQHHITVCSIPLQWDGGEKWGGKKKKSRGLRWQFIMKEKERENKEDIKMSEA